jgi:hypothetical protein
MPGLLDVFTIGFESDTLKEFEANLKHNEKELDVYEKKVKDTEDALKKLKDEGKEGSDEFKKLQKTLEESKTKVDTFKTSVETMKKSAEHSLLQVKNNFLALGKTVARLAIVGATIKKSLDFYEQGEQLQFLADRSSIAAEKLQVLGNAARRYGGTTEGTAGTIENLRSQAQALRMGQGGGALEQAASKYGVGISIDPEKMLENVARRMETLKSDAAKWDLANTLGIDEGTARLLMQGTKAYTEELKRAQKYKLYTKEDLERMRQYRQISLDIRMGIDSIFASIARMLLPAITKVAKVIRMVTDWMAEHEGATKIIATIIAVTAVVLSARTAIMLLSAAFSFLGKSILGTPVGWIIAAITAIIVIINDLIVFMQGGESIIGTILEKLGVDTDKLRENIKNFFMNIKQWVLSAIDWLKGLGGKFAELAKKIQELWDKIPEPLKKLIGMSNPVTGAYTVVTTAKEVMEKVNANKTNSVPAGVQSNYYSTEAQNTTNTNNARSISNTNSKNTSIQTLNVNLNTNNPKGVIDYLSTASEFDNGINAAW